MSLICSFFGHRIPRLPDLTAEVRYEGTQQSFRTEVYRIYQPCIRCGRDFMVGRIVVHEGKIRT